ncbi:MAG: ClpXP protease specificity-enhancing factor SspB [Pseudomonadota bacterium]
MVELNYGRMMQRAMQGLVAEVLRVVAEHGLPGDHHFYIAFSTRHPGVEMPDWLRERFPNDITIVLQYEFHDLTVSDDQFSVRLSFDNRPTRILVPFDAVLQFADPSAEFGLRFDAGMMDDEAGDVADGAAAQDGAPIEADAQGPAASATLLAAPPPRAPSGEDAEGGAPDDADGEKRSGEIVSLDSFRKK